MQMALLLIMVRLVGFEPTRVSPPPPQDGASAVPPQPRAVLIILFCWCGREDLNLHRVAPTSS